MPPFMKDPVVFAATIMVGLQFLSGAVLDLILGSILVGLLAFKSR